MERPTAAAEVSRRQSPSPSSGNFHPAHWSGHCAAERSWGGGPRGQLSPGPHSEAEALGAQKSKFKLAFQEGRRNTFYLRACQLDLNVSYIWMYNIFLWTPPMLGRVPSLLSILQGESKAHFGVGQLLTSWLGFCGDETCTETRRSG